MDRFTKYGLYLLLMTAAIRPANSVEITAAVHIEQGASSISPANVIVWLTPIDGAVPRPAPKPNVRLVQKNKEFTPHLIVVPTGTSIDFPNLDPFFHNVFSLFNGKRFDLGLYEAGAHRSVLFDREGVSYIFCNIHPEMGAVVIALNSPYFGLSDAKGNVAIHDVPPGRYRLEMWSEQLIPAGPANQILDVTAETHNIGPLVFKASNAMPAHHKNKFGKDYPPKSASPY